LCCAGEASTSGLSVLILCRQDARPLLGEHFFFANKKQAIPVAEFSTLLLQPELLCPLASAAFSSVSDTRPRVSPPWVSSHETPGAETKTIEHS